MQHWLTARQVHPSPGEWIIRVFECLRMITTKSSSSEKRAICSGLATKLLDIGSPELLFPSQQSQGEGRTSAFLFVQLITIDIRSMYPTLFESPQSPTYTVQSHQQADRLDILSRFLVYLVDLNDISEIGVEPNLILRLREDISESIAMTIEFLRDRWDDARFSSSEVSTRATSADPTKMRIAHQDPLLMGAIHAVSLWLKEEDSLRKEATGIIDIFLAIWDSERVVGFDHRHVILCALQALANEKEARQQILTYNGWNVLWRHIESIYIHAGSCSNNELSLAINAATLLSDILRVEMVGQMDWAQAVTSALKSGADKGHVLQGDLQLQLQVAFLYLASSCYIGVRMTFTDVAENKAVLDELRKLHQEIVCNRDKAQYTEWITQCLEDITEDLGV